MANVSISRGPGAGEDFTLGETTVIGRSLEADIRIDDMTASRKHVQISKEPNGYVLRDLGSGNGTMLNNQRIEGAVVLEDKDEIGVSTVTFVFRGDGAPATGGKAEEPSDTTTVRIVDQADESEAILESVDLGDKGNLDGVVTSETGLDELRKMHQRLKTVTEVSNAISTILDPKKQLDAIMDSLFDVFLQADRGFIMLMDGRRRLSCPASRVRGQEDAGQASVSRTIAKEVIDKRKGILSSDAMGDDRFAGGQSIVNFQIRSMMCVPLLAQDQVLGLIHVDTMRQAEHFTIDDLNLLASIANQAALSLANARMHKEMLSQEKTKRDLEFARKVQESFLPDAHPEIEGFEFDQKYESALQVGGDFYDFIQLSDTEWALVVGDVSGKGVPAALLMAKMMSDVRFFTLAEREPTKVVYRVNNVLASGKTEDLFVTLLYMKLDTTTNKLTVINAGHLPPVIRRKADGTVLKVEESINYPIGVVPEAEFAACEFQLQQGDVVATFTDGIIEAMNGNKDQYGFERLEAAMDDQSASTSEIMQIILKDVKKFVGKTPPSDDLTLVCFGLV